MHLQWINVGGYNWAGFGLVFVTDWAEKISGNTGQPFSAVFCTVV